MLTVSKDNTHFLRNGTPWYYLADTVWNPFSNLPESVWPDYIAWRKHQGFTAVQISILPVAHDASNSPDNIHPFTFKADQVYDFSKPNAEYFDKARRMVQAAYDADLLPVLGILWKNYVPGTRASTLTPFDMTMQMDQIADYTKYACDLFRDICPMYFISGDTEWNFDGEEDFYMTALDIVRSECPDALLTMHLATAKHIPDVFIDKIDFYMYQSGHRAEQSTPYELARQHAGERVNRPVVNGEPCYEGHGIVGTRHRHTRFNVRKAVWQSLLSGARAGVAYGGHGVWSCHLPGMDFMRIDRKYEPYPWHEALQLEGSWDTAYSRWIWEDYALHDCVDTPDLLAKADVEVAVATTPDRSTVAVYNPFSYDIVLNLDLSTYDCRLIDLPERRISSPSIEPGPVSRVRMNTCKEDSLLLAKKKA